MPTLAEQIATLETAIAAQEALRPTLGDAVVDAVIGAIRAQLAALHEQQQPVTEPRSQVSPEQLLNHLQRYLPKELADKMRAMGRIEGERKQVTVMFADISGFTALSELLDPEEMTTLINEALRELAEAVYQYEGYIDKFVGDAVMAVFGAPIAHEDDPERALRAALAMRERLEDYNRRWIERLGQPLSLHIGINTGTVIAGNVGSDLRLSYTVMGDTVNTASRLEDAAQAGRIFVSRETYRLTREAFTFDALEPITVKGKREPVVVYELKQAKLLPGKTRGLQDLASVFVGREGEMTQLRAIVMELETGQGHIVGIGGEAGLGKSRLMAEWRKEIGDRAYWVEGRCFAHTTSLSYGPFLDLIRRYAGIKDEQSEAEARTRLQAAVDRYFPGEAEAQAIFANLLALQLSPEQTALLTHFPAESLHQRLFALLEALFARLAQERATLLVIEDLHWADATSLELLERLFPLTASVPLMIVGAFRLPPYEQPPNWLALLEARYAEQFTLISLTPLPETASLDLVERLLSTSELPDRLRSIILQKAEGNPFFVEEVIRSLIDRGALVQTETGEGWSATSLIESVSVPDTLQGVLMSRLDRLPAETKWLIQQASVIGRIFLYRVLMNMADSQAIDSELNHLEREDLIRKRARHPEIEYIFKHALTQETAYQSLLAPRRKEFHRKVGEVLETIFAERLGEFYSIIGDHFLRGEAWDKAVVYLVKAGDAAARLNGYAEARLHYARAMDALAYLSDIDKTRRRVANLLIKQVVVSFVSVKPQDNMERLLKAESLFQGLLASEGAQPSDRSQLARIHRWKGRTHFLRNELPEAVNYFQQEYALAKQSGDQESLAIPASMIGRALFFQGHFRAAASYLSEAALPLEQSGNWNDWIHTVSHLGGALAHLGQYSAGLAEVQRGVRRAEEMAFPAGVAISRIWLSNIYVAGGEFSLALDQLRRSIAMAEQSGELYYVYAGYGNKAWAETRLLNGQDALASFERQHGIADALGGRVLIGDWWAAIEAEHALNVGRVEEALAQVQSALVYARSTQSIFAEGYAQRVWGQVCAVLNPPQWNEAETHLAVSLQLLETGEARLEAARTHIAWGVVCRDRGNLSAAREHFEKAAAQFEVSELPRELERVRALRETLATLR